ncbi:hypothetical protein D3C71_1986050 [compost metagenome]
MAIAIANATIPHQNIFLTKPLLLLMMFICLPIRKIFPGKKYRIALEYGNIKNASNGTIKAKIVSARGSGAFLFLMLLIM